MQLERGAFCYSLFKTHHQPRPKLGPVLRPEQLNFSWLKSLSLVAVPNRISKRTTSRNLLSKRRELQLTRIREQSAQLGNSFSDPMRAEGRDKAKVERSLATFRDIYENLTAAASLLLGRY
jgi:hypothetical protein